MRVWDVFICLGHSKDIHVYCRTSKWRREYHHNATSSSPTAHRSPMGGFTMQRCSECVCVCVCVGAWWWEDTRDGVKEKLGKKTGIWERLTRREKDRDVGRDGALKPSSIPLGTPIYWCTFPHVTKETKKLAIVILTLVSTGATRSDSH